MNRWQLLSSWRTESGLEFSDPLEEFFAQEKVREDLFAETPHHTNGLVLNGKCSKLIIHLQFTSDSDSDS